MMFFFFSKMVFRLAKEVKDGVRTPSIRVFIFFVYLLFAVFSHVCTARVKARKKMAVNSNSNCLALLHISRLCLSSCPSSLKSKLKSKLNHPLSRRVFKQNHGGQDTAARSTILSLVSEITQFY